MNIQYQAQKKNQLTRQGKINDPKEWERILMQYQGIFRHQIPEYIKTVVKKNKPTKNYSK